LGWHQIRNHRLECGGWDSNGGPEGGVPPSRGDRGKAKARGGRPPSGSAGEVWSATSNAHPLCQPLPALVKRGSSCTGFSSGDEPKRAAVSP